jgi:hypothetical protein
MPAGQRALAERTSQATEDGGVRSWRARRGWGLVRGAGPRRCGSRQGDEAVGASRGTHHGSF